MLQLITIFAVVGFKNLPSIFWQKSTSQDQHMVLKIITSSGHFQKTEMLHYFICADIEDVDLRDRFCKVCWLITDMYKFPLYISICLIACIVKYWFFYAIYNNTVVKSGITSGPIEIVNITAFMDYLVFTNVKVLYTMNAWCTMHLTHLSMQLRRL